MDLKIKKIRETITTDSEVTKRVMSYNLHCPEEEDVSVSISVPTDFFNPKLVIGDTFELEQTTKQSKLGDKNG